MTILAQGLHVRDGDVGVETGPLLDVARKQNPSCLRATLLEIHFAIMPDECYSTLGHLGIVKIHTARWDE